MDYSAPVWEWIQATCDVTYLGDWIVSHANLFCDVTNWSKLTAPCSKNKKHRNKNKNALLCELLSVSALFLRFYWNNRARAGSQVKPYLQRHVTVVTGRGEGVGGFSPTCSEGRSPEAKIAYEKKEKKRITIRSGRAQILGNRTTGKFSVCKPGVTPLPLPLPSPSPSPKRSHRSDHQDQQH